MEKCLVRYCNKNGLNYTEPPIQEDEEWFCPKCRPVVDKRRADYKEKKEKMVIKQRAASERRKKLDL